MIRKIGCTVVLLWALSFAAQSQETVKVDTIRSVSPVVLGDSTDFIAVEQKARGNWFVTAAVGGNTVFAEANRRYDHFYERGHPELRLSVGKWVTPLWGLRFQVGVGKWGAHYYPFRFYNMYDDVPDHSTMPEEAKKYLSVKDGVTWFHRKFMYMDFQFNLMTDVVRWFTREDKKIGFYLFAGPGFTHAFSSQGLSQNNSFAFKAGGQLDIRLSDKLSLITELQGTIVDESLDGQIGGYDNKINRTLEGYAGWTVGLTYKFGGKKFKRFIKVNPVVLETIHYMRPVEKKEAVILKEEKVDMDLPFTVRFFIDKYTIEEDQKLNIHKVATYLQEHPLAVVHLSGYADRETASHVYNMKLSERRVRSVRNYIIRNYNIAPSRIVTIAKGDVERAYEEDYRWNRAVVMQIIENE
ncbi:OmpA family protein [Phocaeicola sp.]